MVRSIRTYSKSDGTSFKIGIISSFIGPITKVLLTFFVSAFGVLKLKWELGLNFKDPAYQPVLTWTRHLGRATVWRHDRRDWLRYTFPAIGAFCTTALKNAFLAEGCIGPRSVIRRFLSFSYTNNQRSPKIVAVYAVGCYSPSQGNWKATTALEQKHTSYF